MRILLHGRELINFANEYLWGVAAEDKLHDQIENFSKYFTIKLIALYSMLAPLISIQVSMVSMLQWPF